VAKLASISVFLTQTQSDKHFASIIAEVAEFSPGRKSPPITPLAALSADTFSATILTSRTLAGR
jgi:hypothetical protein